MGNREFPFCCFKISVCMLSEIVTIVSLTIVVQCNSQSIGMTSFNTILSSPERAFIETSLYNVILLMHNTEF